MIAGLLSALLAAVSVPSAALQIRLAPDAPGARALIHFGFQIRSPGEALPPALTRLTVDLPRGIGIDTQGIDVCKPAALESGHACPADSQVGQGSLTALEPLGEAIRSERAQLSVFHGLPSDGVETLVFRALGRVPIVVRLVFTARIERDRGDTRIQARIPLESTLPGSPDVAIASLQSTLGTLGRTYYRTRGARRVRFTPAGVTLPAACSDGRFSFKAAFRFNNGRSAFADAFAACGR